MLTIEAEKRLRDIVRNSRTNLVGTFAFAYWINGEGVEKVAFVIGKRKLKLYLANNGRSIKSDSTFIGETSAKDNAVAYSELAELLEKATDLYNLHEYKDHWGHKKVMVLENRN